MASSRFGHGHRVVQAEHLADPVAQPPGVAVERGEPADVHRGQVQARARPSRIHLASARPAPPADAMPTELNPAATQKFRSPGASPRMNWLSGVKLSGPL